MGRLRFALRSLSKAPLLSVVVVASLGLGIGVNTAIDSLLHRVALSVLPAPNPGELVLLTSRGDKNGRSCDDDSGDGDYIFNWRTFRELEKHSDAVTVAGFRNFPSNIAFARNTVNGMMMLVSGRYFSVLGARPALGRLIGPEDDVPGAGNAVAVLDYRYWRDKLARDPDVLNKTVTVNGQSVNIVGIATPDFAGATVGNEPSLFVPMSFKPFLTESWNGADKLADYWVYLLGRLKPGVTRAQGEAALNSIYRGLVNEMADTDAVDSASKAKFRQQSLTLKDGSQGHSEFREDKKPALQAPERWPEPAIAE